MPSIVEAVLIVSTDDEEETGGVSSMAYDEELARKIQEEGMTRLI